MGFVCPPDYEGNGVGSRLHCLMLNWYFSQTKDTVWLSTGPNTKASRFYKNAGWQYCGPYSNIEVKFEMSFSEWEMRQGA